MTLARPLMSFALIFTLLLGVFTPHTYAANLTSIQKVGIEYGGFHNDAARMARIKEALSQNIEESVSQQGQATILMMIVAGAEMVRQNLNIKSLRGNRIDKNVILAQSLKAADEIINGSHLWTGFLGSRLAGGLSSKPLEIINKIIQQSQARNLFKQLLQSGIATFITFLGWEMSSALYAEAVDMIENRADHVRADRLMPMMVSLFRGTIKPTDKTKNDQRILKLVLHNMIKILVTDDDLRNLWLYNTWRTKIATGNFVTSVATMVTASAIGTALFPGAGTLCGMMFGIVGAAVSIIIPQSAKDKITSAIQTMRYSFWLIGDDRGPLFHAKQDQMRLIYECVSRGVTCPPMLRFSGSVNAIEKMTSITIERLFRYESKFSTLLGMKNYALKSGQNAAAQKFTRDMQKVLDAYSNELNTLTDLYNEEAEEMDLLMRQYSFDQQDTKKYPIVKAILNYHKQIDITAKFLREFEASVRKDYKANSADYRIVLYKFYFYGFNNSKLVKILNAP